MAYASRSGKARTSRASPAAHAICDRCGGRYNHTSLNWQYDWAGASIINKRILVCRHCLDNPQQQLRAIVLPADPMPILNPRPEQFAQAETNYRLTSLPATMNLKTGLMVPEGENRITQDDKRRVTQQTGFANGSLNNFPGTDPNAPGNSDPGLPYGNTEVPEAGILSNYVLNPWSDNSTWIDSTIWSE
jgi:hypothetical protein